MIVTVANHKGGVGKTTISVILAETLRQKIKVVLYDLDPQENLKLYLNTYDEEMEIKTQLPVKIPEEELKKAVIIDTPPGVGAETERAIKLADRIYIPIDTTLAGIEGIKKVIAAARSETEKIIVINNFREKSSYDQGIKTAVAGMVGDRAKIITLPVNYNVKVNLTQGNIWNYHMPERDYSKFLKLI